MRILSSAKSVVALQTLEKLQAYYLGEAPLYFKNGTMDIDPKRGLSIHGPVDSGDSIQTIRVGVVSNSRGIQDVTSCFQFLNDNPIISSGEQPFTTLQFPGFQKAFHAKLIFSEKFNEELLSKEISQIVGIENPNTRIRRAAELYAKKVSSIGDKVVVPDVIICHKPEIIERECEEKRRLGLTKEERNKAEKIRENVATHRILAPLDQDTEDFIQMTIKADFRRILKSFVIRGQSGVPVQIFKQSTVEELNNSMKIPSIQMAKHKKEDPSTIAWNVSVGIYYKANHFPWRVGKLGSGSCYIGISFFFDQTTHKGDMFASLAQIFTDTGEGMVVRGDSFKWDARKKGQPHLIKETAQSLLHNALGLYRKHHNDQLPNRVVIHKSSRFTHDEVQGFLEASQGVPRYDYVSLSQGRDVFFYRNGDNPVFRSTFIPMFDKSCLIYTGGYVPYLKSYYGPRVPRPLEITDHHGDTPLKELATEIIALTRLDWNTTRFNLSIPITLKFARRVGRILGSFSEKEKIQHQYRFYM